MLSQLIILVFTVVRVVFAYPGPGKESIITHFLDLGLILISGVILWAVAYVVSSIIERITGIFPMFSIILLMGLCAHAAHVVLS